MAQTGTKLAGNDTPRRRATDRPAYFAAAAPHATFISQLIVGARRRAVSGPSPLAAGAYVAGAKAAVVRMPAGYRTTIDA